MCQIILFYLNHPPPLQPSKVTIIPPSLAICSSGDNSSRFPDKFQSESSMAMESTYHTWCLYNYWTVCHQQLTTSSSASCHIAYLCWHSHKDNYYSKAAWLAWSSHWSTNCCCAGCSGQGFGPYKAWPGRLVAHTFSYQGTSLFAATPHQTPHSCYFYDQRLVMPSDLCCKWGYHGYSAIHFGPKGYFQRTCSTLETWLWIPWPCEACQSRSTGSGCYSGTEYPP